MAIGATGRGQTHRAFLFAQPRHMRVGEKPPAVVLDNGVHDGNRSIAGSLSQSFYFEVITHTPFQSVGGSSASARHRSM